MDLPSPKRRRTSPIKSAPPEDRPNDTPKAQRRASFMSPTKASLARFNPGLLPKATPSPVHPQSRGEFIARGQQANAYIMGSAKTPLPDVSGASGPGGQAGGGQHEQQEKPGGSLRKALGEGEAPEPEEGHDDLPVPTPEKAKAIEMEDTPPRGVLWSTPSKRFKRSKVRPSPAKFGGFTARERQAMADAEVVEGEGGAEMHQANEDAPAQNTEVDPAAMEKRRERDRLLGELHALEGEVRKFEDAIRGVQEDQTTDIDAVINLINSTDTEALKPCEPQKPQPITQLINSFLRFSNPLKQANAPEPRPDTPSKPMPSHKPLDLEDPLPYLRLFTPLTFTSTISLPEKANNSHPHSLVHKIGLSAPQNLLQASIMATVDTVNLSVAELTVPFLSPWASPELGRFGLARAQDRDLGGLCWAIGSYWELAAKRAQCWVRCKTAFEHLIPTSGQPDQGGRAAKDLKGKGKRLLPEDSEDAEEEVSEVGIGREARPHVAEPALADIDRRTLLYYLGRQEFVLRNREVLLRARWRIDFDWTGEARSELDIKVALPKTWREADERGSLGKISQTFRTLADERGVYEALSVVVGLLMPD